ncbi:MAG: PrsW family intramembrane metalloprotease [Deltaproteobacteria bacterium]|nr:PrsW family intramembrane metalloprotease [Deltaproteobacteria bacterium]
MTHPNWGGPPHHHPGLGGGHPGHGGRPWGPAPPPAAGTPSKFDGAFRAGLACTVIGCLLGLLLLVNSFILDVPDQNRDQILASMSRASVLAYLPVAIYLFVPYVVDRYDPEPWWALLGMFLWGALFATGASAVVNTEGGRIVGQYARDASVGELYSLAISAPVFEELFKGIAIFGMVVFLRREFDGVVDGIIYATFVAIGFAATENIIYYARADLAETLARRDGALRQIFILRGVLTPWLHPLFTSMTGIGFGLARVNNEGWKKILYPLLGYLVAVLLHAWWNGLPTLTALVLGKGEGAAMQIVNLLVGIAMALTFFVIVCVLVHRKGQTIKKFLQDEVLIGTITHEELALIGSWGGRLKARLSWRGKAGADFVAAGARLALSKFHTARAMQGQKRTISADFIVPLRQELARLRQQMLANVRR